MGEIYIEEIGIQNSRQRVTSGRSPLVAAAVGKEEFVFGSPILVDTKAHGGVAFLFARAKQEVVNQAVVGAWQVGSHGQKTENLLCDRVKSRGGNNVSGEGGAARYATDRFCGRRIEDLPCQDL